MSQVLVAHTCNPNYSGGRDQEDQEEASPGKQFERPYLEKAPSQKRAGRMVQDISSEFKPQYRQKNKDAVNNQMKR
jgi:hypothetical protein